MTRWEGFLRRARQRRGLTQYQLAEILHVAQPSVGWAERAPRPTIMQLERFARALGYRLEVRFVDVLEEGREDITCRSRQDQAG